MSVVTEFFRDCRVQYRDVQSKLQIWSGKQTKIDCMTACFSISWSTSCRPHHYSVLAEHSCHSQTHRRVETSRLCPRKISRFCCKNSSARFFRKGCSFATHPTECRNHCGCLSPERPHLPVLQHAPRLRLAQCGLGGFPGRPPPLGSGFDQFFWLG